ncbi:putative HTH-type transcriptional regulator TtgW [Mycobacteroides salmoniphilum]|nr:TetR/AcrR family transcriptional regulator [Mycobacteroides salmoniphilum]TDZ78837.1 putative HTH-type transcriptional regulator TtgW [Mycobacteroides salmoniphilum]TDZ86414.1 putative HTH-type transcriptional regulator TtgW [Mycobacteroides salmoniphilum]
MTPEAREQIVDAAAKLFAEQGIYATSMAQIAKTAGISRAWLYRNFDGRDPIVQAALARYSGQAAAMLTDADRHERSVEQAVVAVFCHLVTHGRRQRYIHEALAADPASVIGPAVIELQRYLVEQRAVLPEIQGRIAAEAIARLILSAITTTSITIDFDDPEAVGAFAHQILPRLLTAH